MASDRHGQDPGHPLSWDDLVAHGVAMHGSLSALARALAASRPEATSTESVERALRGLKVSDSDGGVWGAPLRRLVGFPDEVITRLKWMGQDHSRFTDLPTSVGWSLLRPWWATPVADGPERVWLELGRLALQLREEAEVGDALAAVWACAPVGAARAEACLMEAYVVRRAEPSAAAARVSEAEALLADLSGDEHSALHARVVDHRGFVLNVIEGDHRAALALYATIPLLGSPFARARRHHGMGWSCLRLGRHEEALTYARRSVEAAGDGGHLRLRAMSLLLAYAAGGGEGCRHRAAAIADRLEDDALALRVEEAEYSVK